jgi:hypothetical protein
MNWRWDEQVGWEEEGRDGAFCMSLEDYCVLCLFGLEGPRLLCLKLILAMSLVGGTYQYLLPCCDPVWVLD